MKGRWFSVKLPQEFYLQSTLDAAPALLGKYLVRTLDGKPLVCRISETEAYVGPVDKACHAYGLKRTPRTETMFAPGGRAYLYLIYGMYTCLNLVTEEADIPCAVLIRGGQARYGEETMAQNRFGRSLPELTAYQKKNFLNGPGKLCKALSLTTAQNGLSLLGEELYVTDRLTDLGLNPWPGDEIPPEIKQGKRIGVDYAQECADYLWRFYI